MGFRAPTFLQLLAHKSWQQRAQTLPELLEGLVVSGDAHRQAVHVARTVSLPNLWDKPYEDLGLGMEKGGTCTARARYFLDALAEGRCKDNKTMAAWVAERITYRSLPTNPTAEYYLAAVRAVVCDSEELVSSLAVAAERVRERVRAAVEERGGISTRDVLVGHFWGGIVQRTATLDRALDVFYHLRSSMTLHRQMLTTMATEVQRVCSLQDEVRERLRLLPYDPSAWWQLRSQRGADGETAALSFVTFPAAQDTLAQVREAMAQLDAQVEPLMDEKRFRRAYDRLRRDAHDGWKRRLGLDGGRQRGWHAEELGNSRTGHGGEEKK